MKVAPVRGFHRERPDLAAPLLDPHDRLLAYCPVPGVKTVPVRTEKCFRQSLRRKGIGLPDSIRDTASEPHLGRAVPIGHLRPLDLLDGDGPSGNIWKKSQRLISLLDC